MRKISKIIVHCSASPDKGDMGASDVDQWHKARGWSGIGYHFVVKRDGTVETGRPLNRVGAHVKGHNSNSIGIVWMGTDKITKKQKNSLMAKIKDLMDEFGLESKDVIGHYELYSGKSCPNLKMDSLRKELSPDVQDYLPDGPSEEDINRELAEIEKDILG